MIQGASIGGGNILITEINGMAVSFTGQYNTLLVLHYDKPGTIAAVTNFMAYSEVNIGNFRLSRPKKGGRGRYDHRGGRRRVRRTDQQF